MKYFLFFYSFFTFCAFTKNHEPIIFSESLALDVVANKKDEQTLPGISVNNALIADSDIENALALKNWDAMSLLIINYRKQDKQDPILADFSEAAMWRGLLYPERAIPFYEIILIKHPEYDYVRLAYAQALFEAKRYHDADIAFSLIDKRKLHPDTAQLITRYRDFIEKKYKLTFSGNATFERNDNVNNLAKSPEIVINGLIFKKKKSSLPQQGEGIRYRVSANKLIPIHQHHHAELGVDLRGMHYFGKSEFDERQVELSAGYVNQRKRHTWKIRPFAEQTWYGDNRYNNTSGVALKYQYQFDENWKILSNVEYAYVKHKEVPKFDKQRLQTGATVIYQMPRLYLYFGLSKQSNHTRSPDWENTQNRFSLGGQYIATNYFGLQVNGSLARRKFKHEHHYNNVKRKDKTQQFNLGIFNPEWKVYGFMPILNWQYNNTDSNINDLYSKSKQTLFISIDKEW